MPQLGVHADRGESGDGIDLIDIDVFRRPFQEEVDSGHSLAFEHLKGPQSQLLDPFHLIRPERCGNEQFSAVVQILGPVVVEARPGDDFPGERRLGIGVPQDRTLDLARVQGSFHDDLFVELAGLGQSFRKLPRPFHFADPDGGSQVGRFHEAGVAQLGRHLLLQPPSTIPPVVPFDGQEGSGRQSLLLEQALHYVLVHGDGGTQHAGAHVGDIGQLKQALDGAVFSEGTVKHREDHVDRSLWSHPGAVSLELNQLARGGRLGGKEHVPPLLQDLGEIPFQKSRIGTPAALLGDANRDDVVLGAIDGCQNRCRRLQRDFMLSGFAAEE